MGASRVLAVGCVALTGIGLLAAAITSYGDVPTGNLSALALVGLGAASGVAVTAGAGALARSDAPPARTVRTGGGTLLGAAAIGVVLWLAASAPGVSLPLYAVVPVLGVVAAVSGLAGNADARRREADDRARRRAKLTAATNAAAYALRNEARTITSYAETLVDGLADPDDRQRARTIRDSARELSALSERLGEFREALESPPPAETVDVGPLVEDVVDEYRDQYGDDAVQADVDDGLTVRGDDQLATAIDHLVENALTHGSPASPHVAVTATEHRGLVALTVRDRGPGIPEAERELLTGDRDPADLSRPSGLGLWIVRAIVDRHDGTVDVEDAGEGTAVTLSFIAR